MPKSPIPVKDEALGTRELVLTLNKRLAVAVVASATASVAIAAVLFLLFPLKEVKPYIVEVAKDGSAYVPPQAEATEYKPQKATIEFFLRRWVTDAFTINQYSTVQTLDPRARMFLRGANAIAAYKDFLAADGKFELMAKDPTLVRDVEILGMTPIAGTPNGMVIDAKLVTRSHGSVKEERRLVTVYYEFFRPESRKDVEVNPIGIFITDFKVGGA
jgi:type IV secretory pathway component VirB8